MYKGLAQLVGMEVVGKPTTLSEEIDVLEQAWNDYDFFFVHFKYTDSRGEDGNFEEKVRMIEQFDAIVPRIAALKPMVLIVTGDHSTPARLASHSWHPVPTLLVSETCRPDGLTGVRREAGPARRPRPFPRRPPHAAGHGPRRTPRKVRSVREWLVESGEA